MNTNSPIHRIKPFRKGESLTTDKLNATIRGMNRSNEGVRHPAQVFGAKDGGWSGSVTQCVIAAFYGDWLDCVLFDGTNIGTDHKMVLKPPELRRSEWDGYTISGITYSYSDQDTRDATDGSTSETQMVTPVYSIGDIIYVLEFDSGALPVRFGGEPVTFETDLVDANVAARAWARSA